MKAINTAIEEIRNDKKHGASYLTDRALDLIYRAAQSSQANNTKDFLKEMSELARMLAECRPAMVPIGNCASRFIGELMASASNVPDLPSLLDLSLSCVRRIKNDREQALEDTIQVGSSLIAEGDVIISCSYSSTIIRTMVKAHKEGRSFQVMVARSQEFSGSIAYGERMMMALNENGINCLLFADECITEKVAQANKIITGADCVFINGSLLNGYPTAELALAAGEQNVPFYSICESSKFFNADTLELTETGFYLVPPHLVTGIVCEKGLITPAQVYKLIQETHPSQRA